MARGSINRSAGKGKKIASVPYDIYKDGVDELPGEHVRKIMIDVYLVSEFDSGSEAPKAVTGGTMTFEAEGADPVQCSDFNVGMKAIRTALDKHYKIKWEEYLFVTIDAVRIYDGMGSGLSLNWKEVWRGVTVDGVPLMRKYSRGSHSKMWEISPWPETHKSDRGDVIACIPATDENVKALEDFAKRIDEMRKALAQLVAPDQIQRTLELVAGGGLKLLGKHD